jgi:hypothetical protein
MVKLASSIFHTKNHLNNITNSFNNITKIIKIINKNGNNIWNYLVIFL